MPINFKDYTPIPWSRGGPIDLSKAAPTPPPEKTVHLCILIITD